MWSSIPTMRGCSLRPGQRAGDVHVPVPEAAPQGDEVHVVPGRRRLRLPHHETPLLGHLRGVDEADRLRRHRREQTLQHRQAEDAAVVVGHLALEGQLQRLHRPAGQPAEEPAQPLGQRQEAPHGLRRLPGGDVDGVGHEVAPQRQHDLLGDRLPGLVLGLDGRGAEVRGDHHGLQLEQGALRGRLLGEHVDGGALHLTGDDGVRQRLLVDDPAPGDVDDADPRLGLGQQVPADQAHGLGGAGEVDGEEVGLGRHLGHRRQEVDTHLAGPFGAHEGVVGDEVHPEGQRPLGHQPTDPAQAHDPERLAVELDALPLGPPPVPGSSGRRRPGARCGPGR